MMSKVTIPYVLDGSAYEGVLVYDDAIGTPRPGVLLAPDWMGVTERAIDSARRIAGSKFIVLVADMYGAGTRPKDQGEAAALSAPLKSNLAQMRRRMEGALDVLRAEGERRHLINAASCGAVGFCFGGGNVLELSRAGAPLSAAISIHGDLGTTEPARPGTIKPAILVLHGAADPVAPQAQRQALEAELTQAGARWRMLTFGGLVHAFTDPQAHIPNIAEFDATAANWTYQLTDQFLTENFAAA